MKLELSTSVHKTSNKSQIALLTELCYFKSISMVQTLINNYGKMSALIILSTHAHVPSFSGLKSSQIGSSLNAIPDTLLVTFCMPPESEFDSGSSSLIIKVGGSRKLFNKFKSSSENFKSFRVVSNKEINCGLHFYSKKAL